MHFDGIEIPIGVQKRMTIFDAKRRDKEIDRLADRNALTPQKAIVRSGFAGQVRRYQGDNIEAPERLFDRRGFAVGPKALQYLAEYQVADEQRRETDQAPQGSDLSGLPIIQMIDPDRRIDQDHCAFRP